MRNAFAEAAHLADAAQARRNFLLGIIAEMFSRDMVAGQFAQAVLMSVGADLLESQLAAHRFKIGVVGMRQRRSQVHAAAATQPDLCILVDDAFAQRRRAPRKA